MRKGKKETKLGSDTEHTKAILRSLATSFFKYEKITTTITKAKALRPYVEPLITKAVKGGQHAKFLLEKVIFEKEVIEKLLNDIAKRVKDRKGGYTRIIKIGKRPGDAVEEAVIELVDKSTEKPKKEKEVKANKEIKADKEKKEEDK